MSVLQKAPKRSFATDAGGVVVLLAAVALLLFLTMSPRGDGPIKAPVAMFEASTACVNGDVLLGKCFCDPGFSGADCSTPAPGGPLPQCSTTSDLCFKSSVGVCKISEERWKRAQQAEMAAWVGSSGTGDRQGDHLEGFDRYKKVPERLGKVLEVGCGPWTQLGFLLDTRTSWKVDGITLWEPGAKGYMADVPTCSYKDGKLRGHPVKVVPQGAEKIEAKAEYDTIVMINVLEHVQNLYTIMSKVYDALRPGGIFVFCDRWWDTYDVATPVGPTGLMQLDHLYHPIRCYKEVFEHFLSGFTPIYRSDNPHPITKYGGTGTYFIGIKNQTRGMRRLLDC